MDGLDVLYTCIYVETPPVHRFELWPDGEHPAESVARLGQWVLALEDRLTADARRGPRHRASESAQ